MTVFKAFNRIRKANFLESIKVNLHLPFSSKNTFPLLFYGNSKALINNTAKIHIDLGKKVNFNCGARTNEPFGGMLDMLPKSQLIIKGDMTIYAGAHLIIGSNAVLTLAGGFINRHIKIRCFHDIYIGKDVAISENVTIWDTDAHEIVREGYQKYSPVKIGNRVWIGANTTILKGSQIGDNAIIGAGSVVNSNIPANSLAVGNPARVIRHNVLWK